MWAINSRDTESLKQDPIHQVRASGISRHLHSRLLVVTNLLSHAGVVKLSASTMRDAAEQSNNQAGIHRLRIRIQCDHKTSKMSKASRKRRASCECCEVAKPQSDSSVLKIPQSECSSSGLAGLDWTMLSFCGDRGRSSCSEQACILSLPQSPLFQVSLSTVDLYNVH